MFKLINKLNMYIFKVLKQMGLNDNQLQLIQCFFDYILVVLMNKKIEQNDNFKKNNIMKGFKMFFTPLPIKQ
jgi:hypothetical protein